MIKLIHLDYLDRTAGDAGTKPTQKVALLVPSAFVSKITVDVSNIPKRFLAQALSALVEEELAEDIEAVQLCPSQQRGGDLDVLVVSKAKVQEWIDAARIKGFELSAIYPDFYLLPWTDDQPVIADIDSGYQIARLNAHQGVSGSPEKLSTLTSYFTLLPTFSVDLASASLTLSQGVAPVSLMAGEFAPKQGQQGYSRSVLMLASCAALLMLAIALNLIGQGYRYNIENSQLRQVLKDSYGAEFNGDGGSELVFMQRSLERQILANDGPNLQSVDHLNAAMAVLPLCRECSLERFVVDSRGFSLSYQVKTDNLAEVVQAPAGYKAGETKREGDLVTVSFTRSLQP